MRSLAPVVFLVLLDCASRRGVQSSVDARLVEADMRWQDRGALGLGPVEETLLAGLRKPGGNETEFLWRHARLLVERGMSEEAERRTALDSYAAARAQAMRCMETLPAWRQRRHEAGLPAALLVVDAQRRPCLVWGGLAWARWLALLGGTAGSLDIEDVAALSEYVVQTGVGVEVEIGQWSAALVDASRPDWMSGDPERRARGLVREVKEHPNDLARRSDLLWLVAVPEGDPEQIDRQRAAILEGTAQTEVDRAIQKRAKALGAPPVE